MILRRTLNQEFQKWNAKHAAPSGTHWWYRLAHSRLRKYIWHRRMHFPSFLLNKMGPFAFQENSRTRLGEYPWCYYATELRPGMEVIEIGAGASGFQFVLSSEGVNVTSVDPMVNPHETVDWVFSEQDFQRLNRAMGADVHFVRKYLQDANLPSNTYDRVFSISVIEHIPPADVESLVKEVARLLKPGGFFIGTIDLFFDLAPFTSKGTNVWGSNISVKKLIDDSGMTLVKGDTQELYGFDDFDFARIARGMNEFLVFNSCGAQCMVLQKNL